MTATALNSPFMKNYLYKLKNYKIWVFEILFSILCVPLAFIVAYTKIEEFIPIIVISGFGLIIIPFALPLMTFDYHFNKNKVDMIYSQPIKRATLFLSNFLSGLTMIVVPFILQVALSFLAANITYNLKPNAVETYFSKTYNADLARCFIVVFISMLFFYTLTTFCISGCGNIFEAISSSLYINILIPLSVLSVTMLMLSNIYGVEYNDLAGEIIQYICPFGGFMLINDIFIINNSKLFTWVIVELLIIAVIFLLTLFINKKRKAEQVGTPFVVRGYYYVITILIALTCGLMGTINNYSIESLVVSFICFSAFVFLIFEVITNRGFKKFYKSIIRYAVIMVPILIIFIIGNITGFFGMESRVPNADKVKSVTITTLNLYDNEQFFSNPYEFKTSNKNDIQNVINMHENIIEEKPNYCPDDYYYYDIAKKDDYAKPEFKDITTTVEIVYTYKNGSTLKRTYYSIPKYILDEADYIDWEILLYEDYQRALDNWYAY